MARYEGDKIVKSKPSEGSGSFSDLKKAANSQSPVSKTHENPKKYAEGKS